LRGATRRPQAGGGESCLPAAGFVVFFESSFVSLRGLRELRV